MKNTLSSFLLMLVLQLSAFGQSNIIVQYGGQTVRKDRYQSTIIQDSVRFIHNDHKHKTKPDILIGYAFETKNNLWLQFMLGYGKFISNRSDSSINLANNNLGTISYSNFSQDVYSIRMSVGKKYEFAPFHVIPKFSLRYNRGASIIEDYGQTVFDIYGNKYRDIFEERTGDRFDEFQLQAGLDVQVKLWPHCYIGLELPFSYNIERRGGFERRSDIIYFQPTYTKVTHDEVMDRTFLQQSASFNPSILLRYEF